MIYLGLKIIAVLFVIVFIGTLLGAFTAYLLAGVAKDE